MKSLKTLARLSLLISFLLCYGCGQTGALYLPKPGKSIHHHTS